MRFPPGYSIATSLIVLVYGIIQLGSPPLQLQIGAAAPVLNIYKAKFSVWANGQRLWSLSWLLLHGQRGRIV